MLDEIKDVFEKINRDRYIVGYDLNETYAQVSYMRIDSNTPETVSSILGEEEYNIPLSICKSGGRFIVGREAEAAGEMGETVVRNFINGAKENKTVFIDGAEYYLMDLLLLFIQKSMYITPLMTTPEKVAAITITVRDADTEMIGMLKKLPELVKVSADKVFFVSYEEAFHYYMAFQPGELQNHNVLLCDGTGDILRSYNLSRNRFQNPVAVMVESKAHDEVDFEAGLRMPSQLDATFCKVVNELCEAKVYSGVYLIGEGFYGDWCKESIKYLCKGRRVFKGNNLFSKGACLAGREKIAPSGIENKVKYLGNTSVKAEIGIKVMRLGAMTNVMLVKPGEQWFEVNGYEEILLDETNEIEIYLKNMGANAEQTATFRLENLPVVNGRITRVSVAVSMPSETKVTITVKDLGFGEIFQTTGLEWVEELELK